MIRQRSDQRPPWLQRAAAAYWAAADRNLKLANVIIADLVDDMGPIILPLVMLAWIDTALDGSGMSLCYGNQHKLMFGDIVTGEHIGGAEDVEPCVAWAGQLMNARLSDDREMFEALLKSALTGDEVNWTEHVMALVHCCAITGTRSRTFRDGN